MTPDTMLHISVVNRSAPEGHEQNPVLRPVVEVIKHGKTTL
jgi:hypothetical protein